MIKILTGGSPCTHWSIAQTKNRETTASGLGWELFENYLIGLEKYNPDYFLYENNKSMAPAIREQITKELGVEPILINSSLLSAQNRQRYYWTNIPSVKQPEDRGILLKDILESGIADREKAYCLKHQAGNARDYIKKNHTQVAFEPIPVNTTADGKAQCVRATCYKDGMRNMIGNNVDRRTCVAEPIRIGTVENNAKNKDFDSKQYRVYSPEGKSTTLCGQGGGMGAKTGLYTVPINIEWHDGKTYPIYHVQHGLTTYKDKQYPIKLPDGYYIIRKLTVKECMRLQTVPEWFEFPVSNTQAYKMLGNGWTIEVIKHILSHIPNYKNHDFEVLSMYDGMACAHIALKEMGVSISKYYVTEIDKYAIQTSSHNFPDIIHLGDAFQVREDDWRI